MRAMSAFCQVPQPWKVERPEGRGRTVSIRTERRIAHATMKRPLLNINIKPIFLNGLSIELQSIGSGIEMRYRSVVTFITRLTMRRSGELAGWQTSRRVWVVSEVKPVMAFLERRPTSGVWVNLPIFMKGVAFK